MLISAARTNEQRITALAPRFVAQLMSPLRYKYVPNLPLDTNLARIDRLSTDAVSTTNVIRLMKLLSSGYLLGYSSGLSLMERRIGAAATLPEPVMWSLEGVHLPNVERFTETVVYGIDAISRRWDTHIKDTLIEGYYAGESIPDLARRVSQAGKVSRNEGVRLARTITNDVYNMGHLDSYVGAGLDYGQINSHIDDRTSDICLDMDGKIFLLTELDPPPYHMNCRTRVLPWFGGAPPSHADALLNPNTKYDIATFREMWHTPEGALSLHGYNALPTKTLRKRAERIAERIKVAKPTKKVVIKEAKPTIPTTKEGIQDALKKRWEESEYKYAVEDSVRCKGDRFTSDFGKFDLGDLTLIEQQRVYKIVDELNIELERRGIPPIRGIKLIDPMKGSQVLADMGDGVLGINPSQFKRNLRNWTGKWQDEAFTRIDKHGELVDKLANAEKTNTLSESARTKLKKEISELDAVIKNDFAQSRKFDFENLEKSNWQVGDLGRRPFNAQEYFDTGEERLRMVVSHEFGHHTHQQYGVVSKSEYFAPPTEKKVKDVFKRLNPNKFPTEYASVSSHEMWSECFGLYRMGRTDLVPKEVLELIKELGF